MKRVICLYRVSTVGQVDHDDIPMQKLACREYAATHPDWEIVDEISEKGINDVAFSSGYDIHSQIFQKRLCLFDIFPSGYVYICENPLRGGASHGSCQGSGQQTGSNH